MLSLNRTVRLWHAGVAIVVAVAISIAGTAIGSRGAAPAGSEWTKAPHKVTVRHAGGYRYVTDRSTNDPGLDWGGKAPCPKHTHVVGGGAGIVGFADEAHLTQAVPYDGNDKGKAQDDGFWAEGQNESGAPKPFVTVAICHR